MKKRERSGRKRTGEAGKNRSTDRYMKSGQDVKEERGKTAMKKTVFVWGIMAAAALVFSGCSLTETGEQGMELRETDGGEVLAEAVYPEMAPYPDEREYINTRTGEFDDEGFQEVYGAWRSGKAALNELPEADGTAMGTFTEQSVRQFLSGSGDENRICSPVNLYVALAMLAETTGGESRQQILSLLDADGTEELEKRAGNLWKLCYSNDGAVTSLLANSLWLQEGMQYDSQVLEHMKETYHASAYRGVMGSEEYNRLLQDWLDRQTGGLLKDQASGMKLDHDTVFALASTILYQARWKAEFSENNTKEAVFHGNAGDTPCEFLNSSSYGNYYWSDQFAAVSMELNESGAMWIILPDEDVSVDDVLSGKQMFELTAPGTEWKDRKYLKVNLSVPKFDAASDLNLGDGLRALGVCDIFDPETADFSSLFGETDGIFLSAAQHAARVKTDEQGVEAAAYTVMAAAGAAMPPDDEVDFTADRPFLFMITSQHGYPLFAGVVNEP